MAYSLSYLTTLDRVTSYRERKSESESERERDRERKSESEREREKKSESERYNCMLVICFRYLPRRSRKVQS